eukprot:1196124-Prorocentrum_minimum.AAC.2
MLLVLLLPAVPSLPATAAAKRSPHPLAYPTQPPPPRRAPRTPGRRATTHVVLSAFVRICSHPFASNKQRGKEGRRYACKRDTIRVEGRRAGLEGGTRGRGSGAHLPERGRHGAGAGVVQAPAAVLRDEVGVRPPGQRPQQRLQQPRGEQRPRRRVPRPRPQSQQPPAQRLHRVRRACRGPPCRVGTKSAESETQTLAQKFETLGDSGKLRASSFFLLRV